MEPTYEQLLVGWFIFKIRINYAQIHKNVHCIIKVTVLTSCYKKESKSNKLYQNIRTELIEQNKIAFAKGFIAVKKLANIICQIKYYSSL